jgi:hypothetical protein
MLHIGGKNTKKTSSDSKRHFTVVIGNKEHGLYASSSPSSAAKKAVTKLCAANKSKKVDFYIREITQGSKKKTYGPYVGHIEKLKEPIELKGRVIKYKPVAKLSDKNSKKMKGGEGENQKSENNTPTFTFNSLSGVASNNVEGLKKNAEEKVVKAKELRNLAIQKEKNATAAKERATAASEKANRSKKAYDELREKTGIIPANTSANARTNTLANASVNASANTTANVLANAEEKLRTSSNNKISKPNNSSQ